MIYKFIFGDSAYKSSTLPDFSRLDDVLRYKFSHTTIPSNYTLHLINANGNTCPILTQKDYEKLRAMNNDQPIRLRIIESKDRNERGRFGKPEFDESQEISRIEEKKDELNDSVDGAEVEGVFRELLEQLSEEKKQQLLQFKEIVGIHLDENKRKILEEVLAEQAPLIASKIKEAVNEEILAIKLKDLEEEVQEIQKRAELLAPIQKEKQAEEVEQRSFGGFFKGAFNKTGEFFDSLKQKIIGDPYVECEEGRYPKSVVEKGKVLSEIFQDRDKKEILDFINEFESSASVEALADIFAVQKQI